MPEVLTLEQVMALATKNGKSVPGTGPVTLDENGQEVPDNSFNEMLEQNGVSIPSFGGPSFEEMLETARKHMRESQEQQLDLFDNN